MNKYQNSKQLISSNNILKLNNSSFQKSKNRINSALKGQFLDFYQFQKQDYTTYVLKKPNIPSVPRKTTPKNDKKLQISSHQTKIQQQKLINHKKEQSIKIENNHIDEQNTEKFQTSENCYSPTLQQQFQLLTLDESDYSSLNTKSKRSSLSTRNSKTLKIIIERVKILEQKLIYYEQHNKRLIQEQQQKENKINQKQKRIDELTKELQKQQQLIDSSREKIQQLLIRIGQIEKQKDKEHRQFNVNFTNIKQKEQQIKDLLKKNEKLSNINKLLQKQLRESEKKVTELEKQIYKNTLNNQMKLKQSSVELKKQKNKENQMRGGCIQPRKSQQLKKTTMPSKKHRTTSSNSTIISKKLNHLI